MKRALILVVGLAAALLAGKLAFRHFVTDRIMDRGGMEAPTSEDTLEMLDGDGTCVANGILLELLAGSWTSADGDWVMSITQEGTMTLALEGDTVLETSLQFTYLQPGEVPGTELFPDSVTLRRRDGTSIGEIVKLFHESGEGYGTICLERKCRDGTSESVQFHKPEDTP